MNTTFNCKGRLLVIDQPIIMGILNATPDSFYTQGKPYSEEELCQLAEKMLSEGASILDIGGMSTRPKAPEITEQEEKERVLPVIKSIKKRFPNAFLSIDTYRATIAKEAVMAGADMVNDISAGSLDKDMLATVATLNVPYILMHMQGSPGNMQDQPHYNNVTFDLLRFFVEKIKLCEEAGIKDVILDPGFGFGKTIDHNYSLLKGLNQISFLEKPILAGISRKSMIYKLLKTSAEDALNGTTALHMLCLQNGAQLLRVHDVRAAKECIALYNRYKSSTVA